MSFSPRAISVFPVPALAAIYRSDEAQAIRLAPTAGLSQSHALFPTFSHMDTTVIRLDQWLWAARFFKTRSLAKQVIETGKVEVGGQRAKASRAVRVGDALRIVRGEEIFEVEVSALSDRRGSAAVAQTLFTETEASKARRAETLATLRAARAGYRPPETKPDKRARRLIRALGDIDAL